MTAEVWIDGSCCGGGRGRMGIGAVIVAQGFPTTTVSEVCGEGTCNQAVYRALVRALDLCRANARITDVVVYSGSEVLLRQMEGEYTVKDPQLRELHARACRLRREFTTCRLVFVKRSRNTEAKALAREAWSKDRKPAVHRKRIDATGVQP